MRCSVLLFALALAGCGGPRAPDDAAVHARMEQGQSGSWDYRGIERGRAHDATAAEAQAGDIPQGTTVWPVRVSAVHHAGARSEDKARDFLFYQAGEDRHWVGVNAPNGNTERYR